MQIGVFGKVVLNLYRYIVPIVESIDRQIKTKSYNPECSFGESMQRTADEIIGLTERKITLINLKVLVDKSIAKLNENNKKMIMLKYIDNVSTSEICDLLGITLRTYFRRCNSSFDSFCRMLEIQNTLNGDLLSKYINQTWFRNLTGFFGSEFEEKKDNQLFVCDYLLKRVKHIC